MKSNSDMVSAPIFKAVIETLKTRGVNPEELLALSNYQLEDIENPEHKISVNQFDEILEQAASTLGTPSIGLMAGEYFHTADQSLLEFLISSCQTCREAISVLRKYYNLVTQNQSPDFIIGQNAVKVIFYLGEGTPYGNQARAEFVASAACSTMRHINSSYLKVSGIGFVGDEPAHADLLRQYYKTPVHFNQAQYWVSFACQHMDSPVVCVNPKLLGELKEQTKTHLTQYNELKDFSKQVMCILDKWPNNVPMTKDRAASLLNTSSRTLTRRLQEEGCQFSDLAKDARLDKAKQALRSPTSEVQQLALNLGFSDRRGFERAFKQWTGMTPAHYRKQCTQEEQGEALLS